MTSGRSGYSVTFGHVELVVPQAVGHGLSRRCPQVRGSEGVHEGPHRQPGRDRAAGDAHLRAARHRHGRCAHRRRCHRAARPRRRRGDPGGELPRHRRRRRGRPRHRRAGGASRLRLPVGAGRLRRGARAGRDRPGRPAREGDGADGPQGRRPRDRDRGGRARRPAWGRRGVPDPGEGRRGRWRQGHADRPLGRGVRRGSRVREARGRVGVRRRHHPGREVRRARPAHRGPGHRRHPWHRAAPVRARLLHPAPAPEGAGGGARADHRPGHPRAGDQRGGRPRRARRLRQRRHRRVPARRGHRRGLLPRDEHPAPGRAPGHRARVRRDRPGRAPAPGGGRRAAVDRRRRADRPRDRGAGLRRGLLRRLPAAGRHRDVRAVAESGDRHASASELGGLRIEPLVLLRVDQARAARSSPRRTTRCSARWSPTDPTASPPGRPWSPRSTTPRSSG